MPPTTLKLPERLKARVANVVAGGDQSAHAFMIGAIEQQTTLAEQRKQMVAEALEREKAMLRSGKGYAAQDVHEYMLAKAAGKKPTRPKAKAWR